jgi:endonuclease/exonuclease/phosphatase family metal-dependent hydrolase
MLLMLLASCATNGDLIVARKPEGPVEAPARITLLTYNVAGLPEGISQSHPARNMPMISRRLNRYDIVLTQEDFRYHGDLARSATHAYVSEKSRLGFFSVGDGLAVFSRFPITGFHRVTWTASYGVFDSSNDSLAPKGFAVSTIDLGGGAAVDVYDLHMDAGGGEGDRNARAAQARQLIAAVAAGSESRPVIIAGDFNLSGEEPADAAVIDLILRGTGTEDISRALGRYDGRIDKVLFRSGAAVRLVPIDYRVERDMFLDDAGAPLSDHDPLYAEMEVDRAG